jgi:hypothetical protein
MEMEMTQSCSWAKSWIWQVQEKDRDMESVMKILEIPVAQRTMGDWLYVVDEIFGYLPLYTCISSKRLDERVTSMPNVIVQYKKTKNTNKYCSS